MLKSVVSLVIFWFITCNLWAQSEIFISNEQRKINKVDIAAGNCTQTTIVTTSVSLSDITLHPNGKMYGVNFTSRKIYEVNMTNGAVSEILTIPEADKLVGMTADANGLIYITEGDVVPSRLFVVDPTTNTYESKGWLEEGSAGDLTWNLGKLYNASDNNKLVEVNIENPENSIVIGTFTGIVKPNDRIFALVTVFDGCDNSISYGLSEFGDYYRLDMNTAIVDRLCVANIDIYGSTSADEFSASECFVVLDLDKNDSSGETDGDFRDNFNCETTSASIADTDTEILVSYQVDSMHISFTAGILNDTEEFIEVNNIAGININSAIHRIKAFNSGTATADDFENLLKSARYINSAFPATPGIRTLEVIAFSEGRSDTAFVEIELTGVYAGENGIADFCSSGSPEDLFDFIGNNPPNGGAWLPVMNSNTGVFNPAVDAAGNYTYYITDGCFLDSAIVAVTVSNGVAFTLGNDTTICNATSYSIQPNVNNPAAEYVWSTGETSPSIIVTENGDYSVAISIGDCESTENVSVAFSSATLELGNDISICPGDEVLLNADIAVPGASYNWSTGESTAQITVSTEGTFSVVVTNGTCIYTDDIDIIIDNQNSIPIDLGEDRTICEGENTVLNSGYSTAIYEHLWSNGSTSSTTSVSNAGVYTLTLTSSCQTGSDAIEIFTEDCDTIVDPIDTTEIVLPCEIRFPTAFSPNNDNNNDVFGPVNFCLEIVSISFRVYNRFGQELFAGTNTSWDGTYKNEIVPLDNFIWYATYTYADGSIKDAHGNVVIIK